MAAFADVSDLEAVWRPLSPEEAARAASLMEYANEILAAELENAGVDPGGGRPSATLKRHGACAMVRRAMLNDAREGVAQSSVTATPYAESWTYSNPDGALYIGKAERKMLGIGRARLGSLVPASAGDCWGGER